MYGEEVVDPDRKTIYRCTVFAVILFIFNCIASIVISFVYVLEKTSWVIFSFLFGFTAVMLIVQYRTFLKQYHNNHFSILFIFSVTWNLFISYLTVFSLIVLLFNFITYPFTFHSNTKDLVHDILGFLLFIIPIALLLGCFCCTLDLNTRINQYVVAPLAQVWCFKFLFIKLIVFFLKFNNIPICIHIHIKKCLKFSLHLSLFYFPVE